MEKGTLQVPTWMQQSPVAANARSKAPELSRGFRKIFVCSQFMNEYSNEKRPQRSCKKGVFAKPSWPLKFVFFI